MYHIEKYSDITIYHGLYKCQWTDYSYRVFQSFALDFRIGLKRVGRHGKNQSNININNVINMIVSLKSR